jgi:hypothetical protein
MDTSNREETTPPDSNPGISTAVQDTRQPYEKQIAVYLILASLLFERSAYYILDANVADSIGFNATLNWNSAHVSSIPYIFEGKLYSYEKRISVVLFFLIGTEFILMIIFAVISDAKWGRAKTLIIGNIS